MDTNMTAHYMAVQTRQARLTVQAERGWLADQASMATPSSPAGAPHIRQRIGAALIAAGERVQRMPGGSTVSMEPTTSS